MSCKLFNGCVRVWMNCRRRFGLVFLLSLCSGDFPFLLWCSGVDRFFLCSFYPPPFSGFFIAPFPPPLMISGIRFRLISSFWASVILSSFRLSFVLVLFAFGYSFGACSFVSCGACFVACFVFCGCCFLSVFCCLPFKRLTVYGGLFCLRRFIRFMAV